MLSKKTFHATIKLNVNDLCPSEPLHLLDCCEVVDGSVLNDGQEDEQEACPQVDVHGFDVRHLWHRG